MRSRIAVLCVAAFLAIATSSLAAGDSQDQRKTSPKQASEPQGKSVERAKAVPVAPAPDVKPAPKTTPSTRGTETPEPPKPVVENPGSADAQRHGRDGGGYHPPVPRFNHRGGFNDRGRGWGYRGRFYSGWNFVLPAPIFVPYPVPAPVPLIPPHGSYTVCVVYDGSDRVGSDFYYSVRDHLRSYGLTLVTSPDDATLELYITSTDEDPVHPGSASAVSVSYIWNPGTFVTAQVMNVGALSVGTQARSVASYADQLLLENNQ